MRPNLSKSQLASKYASTRKATQNCGYIQLEIKAITLQRLLREDSIVIEEVRGLNKRAKQLAWQAILQNVYNH